MRPGEEKVALGLKYEKLLICRENMSEIPILNLKTIINDIVPLKEIQFQFEYCNKKYLFGMRKKNCTFVPSL